MKKKPFINVLVIAYACEPDKGSEPEVGWQWIKMISEIKTVKKIIVVPDKLVNIVAV